MRIVLHEPHELIEAHETGLLSEVAEVIVERMVENWPERCRRCNEGHIVRPDYLCADCRHGPVPMKIEFKVDV